MARVGAPSTSVASWLATNPVPMPSDAAGTAVLVEALVLARLDWSAMITPATTAMIATRATTVPIRILFGPGLLALAAASILAWRSDTAVLAACFLAVFLAIVVVLLRRCAREQGMPWRWAASERGCNVDVLGCGVL